MAGYRQVLAVIFMVLAYGLFGFFAIVALW